MFKKIALLVITLSFTQLAHSQSFKIIGTNTLMGAATGTGLGFGTMMINNNFDDFGPLRVGFGAGTLAGLGLGVYDVTYSSGFIDGYLTSASTTGQVVAMDTFYGAATGAVVGFAITLISNDDILSGGRVGAGIGAYAGFLFGLAESFLLNSGGSSDIGGYGAMYANPKSVNGFVQVTDKNYSLGILSPSMINTNPLNPALQPTVQVSHLKINF